MLMLHACVAGAGLILRDGSVGTRVWKGITLLSQRAVFEELCLGAAVRRGREVWLLKRGADPGRRHLGRLPGPPYGLRYP